MGKVLFLVVVLYRMPLFYLSAGFKHKGLERCLILIQHLEVLLRVSLSSDLFPELARA